MTKQQFTQLESSLLQAGYKKYTQQWNHEDYILCKGFHKSDNKWDDERNAYQIILSVYDYTNKPYAKREPVFQDKVGITVRFDVSRVIEERFEMFFSWENDTSIEKVEKLAESFYSWIACVIPKPNEE